MEFLVLHYKNGLKDERGKNKQQELSEIELIKLENKKLKIRIE